MRAAALFVVVAACHAASPGAPDAHPDAVIVLPDARTSGDPCVGSIALDDLGACLGRAYCARLAECGFGDAGDTDCGDLPYAIDATLTARTLATAVRTSSATGRVIYDPAAAPACLASIEATPCRSMSITQMPIDGCTMLVGRVDGGTCAYPYECAAGTECVYTNGNYYVDSCGQNVCKQRGAPGVWCTGAPCAAGARCVYESPNYVCESGQAGGGCNYDYDCDTGFWCDYQGTSHADGAGACTPGFGVGQPCTSDGQCGGQLSCVGPAIGLAGSCVDTSIAGVPCDGWCLGPLKCAVPVAGQLGTCVAQPRIGDPCVPGAGCGTFLRCDDRGTPDPSDDVCVARGELGATCAPSQCNVGDVCTADVTGRATGTCVEPLPDGTGCLTADECASGACTSEVCAPFAACNPFIGGGGVTDPRSAP